ncbi:hypothetical protein L202_02629 [Cryptococcus amylolentus CBS 6039]|uniref:Uncharacterized protein n=1 Tax=Cryptococcus amylolentus CBS 6039 TaxID=1295533 RepID=A0A1E3HX80_9TREE|nr:hypothetical protein L202_02629 [Cryptococcus amylolentus CBS 6039]ODN80376.1 hypothetical protein L202_02629 [Cryptococcus amylolentus CBS 6039]
MSTSLAPLPSSSSSSSLSQRRSSLPAALSTPLPSTPSARRPRTSKTPLSVQLFQEKHLSEFPHLYSIPDPDEQERLMEQEREALEEARRIGRFMRESILAKGEELVSPVQTPRGIFRPLSLTAEKPFSLAEAAEISSPRKSRSSPFDPVEQLASQEANRGSFDDVNRRVPRPLSLLTGKPLVTPSARVTSPTQELQSSGRRPLSLLSRRQLESRPMDLVRVSEYTASDLSSSNSLAPPVKYDMEQRTPDLSTPVFSDTYSPDPTIVTPGRAHIGLALQFQSPNGESAADEEEPSSSEADTSNSFRNSTYSWATSFSGETEELRTAAQYVPSRASREDSVEKEEVLGTPDKAKQRRKRIVAIAHTVRQLEGVGSREVEDPTLYSKLAKAWNDRPGVMPTEPVWTPAEEVPPLLPTPFSEVPSHISSESSGPFRYSLASSIHDLGEEGAVERGAQILSEKAWLKTPLYSSEAYFGAHSPSQPFPSSSFVPPKRGRDVSNPYEARESLQSEESKEERSPPVVTPKRVVRRVKTDISQLKNAKMDPSSFPDMPPTLGLGFSGTWLMANHGVGSSRSAAGEMGPDFQHGEGGVEIKEAKKGYKHHGSIHSLGDLVPQSSRQPQPPVTEGNSLETIDLTLSASRPTSYYNTPAGRRHRQSLDCDLPPPPPLARVRQSTDYQRSSLSRRPACWTPSITSLPQHIEHQHQLAPPIDLHLPGTRVAHGWDETPSPPPIMAGMGEEMDRSETEEGEWVEDLGSYRSSVIYSYRSRSPSPSQSPRLPIAQSPIQLQHHLQVRPKSIPPTTPVREEDHLAFPDMLNMPAREEVGRERGEEGAEGVLRVKSRRPSCGPSSYPDTSAMGGAREGMSEGDNYDPEKATVSSKSQTPSILFVFGFLMPLLWLVGGWLLPSSSTAVDTTTEKSARIPNWLYHPHPRVFACRVASVISIPLLLIVGIILAIVLPLTL